MNQVAFSDNCSERRQGGLHKMGVVAHILHGAHFFNLIACVGSTAQGIHGCPDPTDGGFAKV